MTVQTAMNSITTGLFYLAIITAIIVVIILAFMLFDYLTQPKEEPENYVERFLRPEDEEAIHNILHKVDFESSYPKNIYDKLKEQSIKDNLIKEINKYFPKGCVTSAIIDTETGTRVELKDASISELVKLKNDYDYLYYTLNHGYNPYQE